MECGHRDDGKNKESQTQQYGYTKQIKVLYLCRQWQRRPNRPIAGMDPMKVCPFHIRAAEVRVADICMSKIGLSKPRPGKVCPVQVRPDELGAAQVRVH